MDRAGGAEEAGVVLVEEDGVDEDSRIGDLRHCLQRAAGLASGKDELARPETPIMGHFCIMCGDSKHANGRFIKKGTRLGDVLPGREPCIEDCAEGETNSAYKILPYLDNVKAENTMDSINNAGYWMQWRCVFGASYAVSLAATIKSPVAGPIHDQATIHLSSHPK